MKAAEKMACGWESYGELAVQKRDSASVCASLPQSGVFRIVLCAAIWPEIWRLTDIPAKTSWRDANATDTKVARHALTGQIIFQGSGEQTTYGNTIHTGNGFNNAELHRTLHHGSRAVLHLRVHHQPEHGAGAASKVDFRSALCMGHAGGVGVLPRLLCLLVADFKAD